jgi:hypothetical protein
LIVCGEAFRSRKWRRKSSVAHSTMVRELAAVDVMREFEAE